MDIQKLKSFWNNALETRLKNTFSLKRYILVSSPGLDSFMEGKPLEMGPDMGGCPYICTYICTLDLKSHPAAKKTMTLLGF